MRIRYLLAGLLFLSLGILMVPMRVSPPWLLALPAMGSWILAVFLGLDHLLGRWLRGQAGRQANLATFVWSQAGQILGAIGCLTALIFLLLRWRLTSLGAVSGVADAVVLGAMGLAVIGGFLTLLRRVGKEGNPLGEIRSRLTLKSPRRQIVEAWEFQLACGLRLVPPLGLLALAGLLVLFLAFCTLAAIWFLGFYLEGSRRFDDPFTWPAVSRVALLVLAFLVVLLGALGLLTAVRVVDRMRRVGRFKIKQVWIELGFAFETVGLKGTVGWLFYVLLVMAGSLGAAGTIRHLAGLIPGFDGIPALLVGGLMFVVCFWMLVFWPLQLIISIFLRRDCGWMSAFDASLALIRLDGGWGLGRALLVTASGMTIVGLPFALHLLAATLDYHDLLIASLLHEKTGREIEMELGEQQEIKSGALAKYYRLLESGRYLDALNGFQLHLRANRQDRDALRGQALAYLRMGNPKAREGLEIWMREEPDSAEAQRLHGELEAGHWSENGDLFRDAQRRCTQQIGRGTGSLVGPGWDPSGGGTEHH